MKRYGSKWGLFALVAAIALVLGMPVSAFASSTPKVSGVDYLYANDGSAAAGSSSDIDILSVDGTAGSTVFVDVSDGTTPIAKCLPFTLSDSNSTKASDGSLSGVVSVSIDGFSKDDTYTVNVYADRAEKTSLYSGTIEGVRAKLGTSGTQVIAMRTLSASEATSRAFNAPETISLNSSVRYALVAGQSKTGLSTYEYALDSSAPNTVDGSITYVDDNGAVLATDAISGIAKGEQRVVSIPTFIVSGGKSYYTVSFTHSVTASYSGTIDFVVRCKPAGTSSATGAAKTATIKLVGSASKVEATDTVSLKAGSTYLYAAPTTFYRVENGILHVFTLAKNEGVLDSGRNTLTLSYDTVKTDSAYEIAYDETTNPSSVSWTVELIDGSADPSSSSRVISTKKIDVAAGKTETYTPESSIDVNGTKYVPVKSTKASYSYAYGSGDDPITYIYYVPENYTAPSAYTVTVNYVDLTTGTTIKSETRTESPDMTEDDMITSPASLTVDGVDYVRLAGQDKPIQHGFYTQYRTYTIYYRNVNDTANENTVITHFRVEYADGGTTGTTVTPGTTVSTGTNGTNGTNGTTTGTSAVGISTGNDLNTVNNGDGTSADVLNGSGQTPNEQRIDDEQTPLASGTSQDDGMARTAAIAGIAAAVVAAVIAFVVIKRRKKAEEATEAAAAGEDQNGEAR
ncbi:MAG: hypothetical protein WAY93_10565 [Atopobiaceae bacterium]|jgi:hypothetical protein